MLHKLVGHFERALRPLDVPDAVGSYFAGGFRANCIDVVQIDRAAKVEVKRRHAARYLVADSDLRRNAHHALLELEEPAFGPVVHERFLIAFVAEPRSAAHDDRLIGADLAVGFGSELEARSPLDWRRLRRPQWVDRLLGVPPRRIAGSFGWVATIDAESAGAPQ